jgi:hypothetical protein
VIAVARCGALLPTRTPARKDRIRDRLIGSTLSDVS